MPIQNRYKIFLSLVNEIWRLEKEKDILRDKLTLVNRNISSANSANGITNDVGLKSEAAQLGLLIKKKNSLEEEMETIREKQREKLKEIGDKIVL